VLVCGHGPAGHCERADTSGQSGGHAGVVAAAGHRRFERQGDAGCVALRVSAVRPRTGLAVHRAGGAFGYFVAFPAAVGYLLEWIVESHLTPIIDVSEYFKLLFMFIVALGLSFQIPAIVFELSRIGLVSARFRVAKLKYAVFGCVIAAAILTLTTDPGNMLVLAGPMIVLYCVAIVVAWEFGCPRTALLE
jgi:hypothetical protein